MSVEALKSTSITNLDANPVVANTTGEGAAAVQYVQSEYVTVSALASVTSTYRMIRVPTTVKLKEMILESEALGGGRINISAYYSDSTTDGTAVANQGLIVPSTGDQFFASDIDLTSAQNNVQVMNESGNNGLANRNLPFWSALGLTANPGGNFDIVLVVHTTAVTNAGKVGLRLSYTM
jgi:hypothetical protein